MKASNTDKPLLWAEYERTISFYDIDALRVVWHGNYVKYLETAREVFGHKYGLEYLSFLDHGYIVPVTDLHIQYKQVIPYEETIIIRIEYVPTHASKIIYRYQILRKSDHAVMTEATTTQHFVREDNHETELAAPAFYKEWQKKWGQR